MTKPKRPDLSHVGPSLDSGIGPLLTDSDVREALWRIREIAEHEPNGYLGYVRPFVPGTIVVTMATRTRCACYDSPSGKSGEVEVAVLATFDLTGSDFWCGSQPSSSGTTRRRGRAADSSCWLPYLCAALTLMPSSSAIAL